MAAYPPSIICWGTIANFDKEIGKCQTAYTKQLNQLYDCGYWKAFKFKCIMGAGDEILDPRCWAVTEVKLLGNPPFNAGRTCNGVLEGLDRLIPDMSREIAGEPVPTSRSPVRWILGGSDINYELERYDGWKCGDLFQPPNIMTGGTYNIGALVNDPDDDRNDYKWWFIVVYDHKDVSSSYDTSGYTIASYNEWRDLHPQSPINLEELVKSNLSYFQCSPGQLPPVPPTVIHVTCTCNPSVCPVMVDMGIARSEMEAAELRLQCHAQLSEMVATKHPEAIRCQCLHVNDPKPPIVYPPPPVDYPPTGGWEGGGGGIVWDRPPTEQNIPTWGWSGPSGGWTGGGGGVSAPGGPSGGEPGEWKPSLPPPPQPLERCHVIVRTAPCPLTERQKLRELADNVVVPMNKNKMSFREDEVIGLEDATYWRSL
jgi:hypothetical protein